VRISLFFLQPRAPFAERNNYHIISFYNRGVRRNHNTPCGDVEGRWSINFSHAL